MDDMTRYDSIHYAHYAHARA